MTLEFLSPTPNGAAAPPAASPLEPWLRAAGARFEARHGWRVAVAFDSPAEEAEACRSGVGITDRSAMGKLEVQGRPGALDAVLRSLLPGGGPTPGQGARLGDSLLWRSSGDRALALCEPAATARLRSLLGDACGHSPGCGLVELTAGLAAFELRGPLARDLLERLSAIDLRPDSLPPGGVRAGMVAGVPATIVGLEPSAYLVLVGAPEAPDAWEIVLDAGAPLGLRPIGEEARAGA